MLHVSNGGDTLICFSGRPAEKAYVSSPVLEADRRHVVSEKGLLCAYDSNIPYYFIAVLEWLIGSTWIKYRRVKSIVLTGDVFTKDYIFL